MSRLVKARGQDSELAREASQGEGPVYTVAGKQTENVFDCTVFALANAANLPYGVVAARATEFVRQAQWRSAEERANPQKTIENIGLSGGEVLLLAEAFGRAQVVKPSDFAETLRKGKPIMVNLTGHEVVLTKIFVHKGERWYEILNSFTDPQERQYVNEKQLPTLLVENGVAFSPDASTIPQLKP